MPGGLALEDAEQRSSLPAHQPGPRRIEIEANNLSTLYGVKDDDQRHEHDGEPDDLASR